MHQRQIISNINRYLKNERITSVRMIMRSDKGKYLKNEEKPLLKPVLTEDKEEKESYSGNIESIKDDELKKTTGKFLRKKLQGN